MEKLPHIIGENFITVVVDGTTETLDRSHVNFQKVKEAIKAGDFSNIANLMNLKKAVVEFGEGLVAVKSGVVYYNNKELSNSMTDRILALMRDGFDIQPLVKFLDNLMQNPSHRAVNELYGFLEVGNLPITHDGYFIAFKKVREDYKDIWSGTFDNSVGAKPSMPRNKVDEDKHRTCSNGLHFASYDYMSSYGAGSGNRVMLLKINPRDVVAIPTDYNNAKGRCCAYEVVGESDTWREENILHGKAVYGAEPKPKPKPEPETVKKEEKIVAEHTIVVINNNNDDAGLDMTGIEKRKSGYSARVWTPKGYKHLGTYKKAKKAVKVRAKYIKKHLK